MEHPIQSFKTFYPYYLKEHANGINRLLHFIGTSLVLILTLIAIFEREPFWLVYIPIAGYGFAWVGHFFFEKNRPATFKYPLWSLISDFKMYFEILLKKIPLNPEK